MALSKVHEYAFGLNPKAQDAQEMPAAHLEGGYLTITLTKRPGVSYKVETAGALEPIGWSDDTTEIRVNTDSTLTVRDTVHTNADSSRFLRVRVTAP